MSSLARAVLVVLVVGFTACDVTVDVGDGGSGGGGGGASGGGAGGGSGGGSGGGTAMQLGCSTASPCPSGQFCFNGLCAYGCQTNSNCAADQYCDTEFDHLCHNKVVESCASMPSICAATQTCVSGFCSTPPPATQCDLNQVASGNDGCATNAICVDSSDTSVEDPKCYTFPACAQDKTCPTGLQGAVCNDGLIPNKARICLTGLCQTTANCPANWACVKFSPNDVLGMCSNKGTGSPCTSSAECTSGNCSIPAPGFPGFCL